MTMAWPLLLVLLLMPPAQLAAAGGEPCGSTRDGADKGILRAPRPLPNSSLPLNCTWTLRAAPGQRLLVRLDSVELPPLRRAALRLSVDGRVTDITRDCVNCLDAGPALAGHTVQVHFVSSALANGSDSGSFQLRYQAFDPERCEQPRPPNQGSVVGRDWRVGQEVRFACNPPLDPVGGGGSARCERGEDGVPRWSRKAPRCALSDCRRGSVRREAGAGAIASPGYTERRLPANRRCHWDIRARPGHQVRAAFTQLRLPRPAELYLFDGDESRPLANNAIGPLNVTTASNRLLVVLQTAAQQLDGALMYMEYEARAPVTAHCPEPGAPEGGEALLMPQQGPAAVGSRVTFRCRRGHSMHGEAGAECLPSGRWSAPPPQCVAESAEDAASSGEDDLGGPRGFVVTEESVASVVTDVVTIEAETTEPWSALPTTEEPLARAPQPTASEEALDPLPQSSTLERERWRLPHVGRAAAEATPSAHRDPEDSSSPSPREELEPHGTDYGDLAVPSGSDDETVLGDGLTVTAVAVIVAVTAPLAVALLLLVVLVAYRRHYPVRMNLGRKFPTFENPAYVRKDARDPRELARLSVADRF